MRTMPAMPRGMIASCIDLEPRPLLHFEIRPLQIVRAACYPSDSQRGQLLPVFPNSVDTLSPNNRFVKIINTIPIQQGIPYHSIIGDRGKGGNPDHTKPMSSDGFVPYWSSHLKGAQSELIVPSGHSAHQNPTAIKEVRRILLLP